MPSRVNSMAKGAATVYEYHTGRPEISKLSCVWIYGEGSWRGVGCAKGRLVSNAANRITMRECRKVRP